MEASAFNSKSFTSLLGGALLGGLNKKVTYVVEFKDGRKFLATSGMRTFKQIENTVLMTNMK